MLLVGKQLKISSSNLSYGRMLLIVIIGTFFGNFFKDLFPLSVIIATAIVILIPTKTQLKISWIQAIILTISGLAALFLLNYISLLLIPSIL
jgi:hypothetical protein